MKKRKSNLLDIKKIIKKILNINDYYLGTNDLLLLQSYINLNKPSKTGLNICRWYSTLNINKSVCTKDYIQIGNRILNEYEKINKYRNY